MNNRFQRLHLLKRTLSFQLQNNFSNFHLYFQTIYSVFFNIFFYSYSHLDTKWKHQAITIAGGNGKGNRLDQLSYPLGISMDDDQTIYVADCGNDRIIEWQCNSREGRIVAGGNGRGDQMHQLNQPADVIIDRETDFLIIADRENRRVMRWSRQNNTHGEVIISDIDCARLTMDKNESLYVSDWKKNEVRRWKRGEKGKGTIVAGGNGRGHQLNQLNNPTFIFVDEDESLYVSDSDNHRVMKWVKDGREGVVVAGGNGQGDSWRQLYRSQGVLVDRLGHIYVTDYLNHRVMRWCEGAKEGTLVIGGNGEGQQSNQLNGPVGLSFDRQGNLYVADCWNHRIQKFVVE